MRGFRYILHGFSLRSITVSSSFPLFLIGRAGVRPSADKLLEVVLLSETIVIPKEYVLLAEVSARAYAIYLKRKLFAAQRMQAMRPYTAKLAVKGKEADEALKNNDIVAYKKVLSEIEEIRKELRNDPEYQRATEKWQRANKAFKTVMEVELPKALAEAKVQIPTVEI
jgi:hypothetical protein